MSEAGWLHIIKTAAEKGDTGTLEGIARQLERCDKAKQIFCDLGWSWTGLGILETAEHIQEHGKIVPKIQGFPCESQL